MTIDYPDNFSLEQLNNNFLWKYVGLHKLLDLVLNQIIYFARLDSFEDGVEGLTGRGLTLKAFTQGKPLTPENVNPRFAPEKQKELIEGDKFNRVEYLRDLSLSQQTQFASCWFLGNRESLAMWKLYSNKDGVAIKFNARELTDTIIAAAENYTHTDFEILIFGPVEYKNIWPYDHKETFKGKNNAMKKDKSYSHESEFRFITVVPVDKKGVYNNFTLPIGDLSSYEVEIITNPFMQKWEIDNLKKLLEPYHLETKIIPSSMDIKPCKQQYRKNFSNRNPRYFFVYYDEQEKSFYCWILCST
ncbi:MAG: DUF2971 domain-containing protein [Bacteroidota bacterium]|nr:DUF2971 domain-containing protein [Bacteroidota bacterium]